MSYEQFIQSLAKQAPQGLNSSAIAEYVMSHPRFITEDEFDAIQAIKSRVVQALITEL